LDWRTVTDFGVFAVGVTYGLILPLLTEDISMGQIVRRLRVNRVLQPFQEFFRQEAAGGILLLVCTIAALVWANSPWAGSYHALWHTELRAGVGNWNIAKPFHVWINDGLMAIFFFSVGLEIKREVLVGELAAPRRALLPIAAALGGMLVPAGIYLALNAGRPGAAGWGIPMATDIAFALGVLAMLGNRVCFSIKVFLTALAIADDIGAVLVIALFYTSQLSFAALGIGMIFLLALYAANRGGVDNPLVYTVLGIGLWAAFLQSGVHPTVAGVVIAATIPVRPRLKDTEFLEQGRQVLDAFRDARGGGGGILANERQRRSATAMVRAGRLVQTPLQRIEHELHPWVTFVIMPLFALANAGVSIGAGLSGELVDRVSLGIMAGLVLGKQAGITLFAWLAVRSGMAQLPGDMSWKDVHAAATLGGIGFTMSLFIANLAFGEGRLLAVAKIGILAASLVSGIAGWMLFRSTRACSGRGLQPG
jgi:NhaA family Na+:H+ antiporter